MHWGTTCFHSIRSTYCGFRFDNLPKKEQWKKDVQRGTEFKPRLNDGCRGEGWLGKSYGAASTLFPAGRWSCCNCFELMVSSITKQHFVQIVSWSVSPRSQEDKNIFKENFCFILQIWRDTETKLETSSPLFVQLMHTNYYKIVKQLKSFKIIIVAPTCFGLHKPSSGSYQPVLR